MQEHDNATVRKITDAPMDFTSWATEKASDSVKNHVQYAAWRRMGVPIDIAMWLMKLDIGGAFVLYSSHSKKRLDKVEMVNQHDTSHHAMIRSLGFSPERGCTQGDVKSLLSWICFFDTLVKTLNQCQPDKYPKA
jgi:hypothetical protein